MMETGASDLHLRSNGPSHFRVDGKLSPLEGVRFDPAETQALLESILPEHLRETYKRSLGVDFSYAVPGASRFRCNAYRERGHAAAVFRRVSSQIPDFESLHLPASIKSLADQKWGLVLVTGPTGNGKSTTLASIVEYINRERSCHIVTVEDPVEYVYEDKQSIISQRELGTDTLSFSDALRHVLRQDPNVILVGEMRDLETVETVLRAAETGHFVLSTLHTSDAIQTVSRVVDVFPPHHQGQARMQLAEVLKGVVSQRLLPKSSGSGRVPACEVLTATAFVKKSILENNVADIVGAMRQGQYYGMQTFQQSLLKLLDEKMITLESALEAAPNPEELMMAVKGIQTGADSIRPA